MNVGDSLYPFFEVDENRLIDNQLEYEKERGITIGEPIQTDLPTSQEVRKWKKSHTKLRGIGFTKKASSKRKK